MAFRDITSVAVEAIATHLGEAVTLDGHCIRGIARIGTSISGALAGPQVSSKDATVNILNIDADRLQVRKGMDVDLRDRRWIVREVTRSNSGWTLLELE